MTSDRSLQSGDLRVPTPGTAGILPARCLTLRDQSPVPPVCRQDAGGPVAKDFVP